MKIKRLMILAIFTMSQSVVLADSDCTNKTIFPTTTTQCSCIINNAITDCKAKSRIKSICNTKSLNNLFKKDQALAEAQCQRYGGHPQECQWSVTFYDKNC